MLTNPHCTWIIPSMKALLLIACILPSHVMANEGLDEEVEINEGLITIRMANAIRNACPEISARLVEAFIFLKSLEIRALKLGYTSAQIKKFINNAEEKDRVLKFSQARLTNLGVLPDQPATYCTVGLAEIQIGSAIGKLLKAK